MQPLCLASPIFQRQQLTKEVKHVAEQDYRGGTAEQQEDEQLCGCSSVQSSHVSFALCTFVTVLGYQFLMAALIDGACKRNMLQQTHMQLLPVILISILVTTPRIDEIALDIKLDALQRG